MEEQQLSYKVDHQLLGWYIKSLQKEEKKSLLKMLKENAKEFSKALLGNMANDYHMALHDLGRTAILFPLNPKFAEVLTTALQSHFMGEQHVA